MDVSNLPTLNALLNSLSGALLTSGYVLIRQGWVRAHRACMLAAFVTSTVFLISYLIYHANVGTVAFTGQGGIRIVLAALILPLALVTLYRALRGQFEHHRRIARWTLPIWLYVSVTGIIVYLMLYHL